MAPRRRSESNEDGDFGGPNYNLRASYREALPRKCKTMSQSLYGVDTIDAEESYQIIPVKKARGSLAVARDKPEEDMNPSRIALNFLAWLRDTNVLGDFAGVRYRYVDGTSNNNVIGRGVITKHGIICICCMTMFPVSVFSAHIGDHLGEKPYEKMFIAKTNVSLLSCLIEAWNNRHSVPARSGYHHVMMRHDNSCVVCSEGGNLFFCYNCPSAYHAACIGFRPRGPWLCPYCHCKYCDKRGQEGVTLTCTHCLKKYHQTCCEKHDNIPPKPEPQTMPFCGITCWKVYNQLEEMQGKSIPIGKEKTYRWTLVRKMELGLDGENNEDMYKKVMCNSMICLAEKLMEDNFNPIIDRQTRTNLIQSVLYSCGSNHTRTNFSRFYTAVLEDAGNVRAVATLRLHSPNLAEIPFIATNEKWRKKGMCKILLSAIESAVAQMGVEHIVILSSMDKAREWQERYNFRPLGQVLQRQLGTLNALAIPEAVRLRMDTSYVKRVMLKHDLNLAPMPPTPRRG